MEGQEGSPQNITNPKVAMTEKMTSPLPEAIKIKRKEQFEALPEQKVKACVQSVRNITARYSQKGGLDERHLEALKRTEMFLRQFQQDPVLRENPDIADKIVRLTVATLDRTIVDEIAPYRTIEEADATKTDYYREVGKSEENLGIPQIPGYENPNPDLFPNIPTFFMASDELDALIRRIEEIPYIKESTTEPRKFLDSPFNIYYTPASSLTDIIADVRSISRLHPARTIVIPFKFGEIAGIKLLQSKKRKVLNQRMGQLLFPRSELPRQDIWQSFLSAGRELYADNAQQTDEKIIIDTQPLSYEERQTIETALSLYTDNISTHLTNIADILPDTTKSDRLLRRKGKVGIDIENDEIYDAYLQKEEEQIGRALGRDHIVFGSPKIVLTRSGVSANDAATEIVAKMSGSKKEDRPKAMAFHGLYYENHPAIYANFETNGTIDDAQVFFVNTESSQPGLGAPEDYASERDKFIAAIKTTALAHPDQPYWLVVDKTNNPLFKSFSKNSEPDAETSSPTNLSIIETTSISKLQRGGSHYFYGALFYWGKPQPEEIFDESVLNARGKLTKSGIIHFPRLTRTEVEKIIDEAQEKNRAVATAALNAEVDIPQIARIVVESYSRFTYFVLPYKEIINQLIRDGTAEDELHNRLNDLGLSISGVYKLLYDMTQRNEINEERLSITVGDSFGLDATRLTVIKTRTSDLDETPYTRVVAYPRISPGTATSINELQEFTTKFIGTLEKRIAQVFKTQQVSEIEQ